MGGGQGGVDGVAFGIVGGGVLGRVHRDHLQRGTSRSPSGSRCCSGSRRALAGAFAANGGIDLEALKARYIPQATIDTTKETIEWAQSRMPGGRRP